MPITNANIHPINIDVSPLQLSNAKPVKAKLENNVAEKPAIATSTPVKEGPALNASTQVAASEPPKLENSEIKQASAQQAYAQADNKSQVEVEQSKIDLSA